MPAEDRAVYIQAGVATAGAAIGVDGQRFACCTCGAQAEGGGLPELEHEPWCDLQGKEEPAHRGQAQLEERVAHDSP